jgi:hypothetical protein
VVTCFAARRATAGASPRPEAGADAGPAARAARRLGLVPGAWRGKDHRPEHLGYAGRRVLVSRKWSAKTLADHRADRKAWLLEKLGLSASDDNGHYAWKR